MSSKWLGVFCLPLLSIVISACNVESYSDDNDGGGGTPPSSGAPVDSELDPALLVNSAADTWEAKCSGCHGNGPDEGTFPVSDEALFSYSLEQLVEYNSTVMDGYAIGGCDIDCSEEVSRYMLAGYTEVEEGGSGDDDGGNDDGGNEPPVAQVNGEESYEQFCAGCHGDDGAGGSVNIPLFGESCVNYDNLTSLAIKIEDDMPPSDPTNCEGDCADAVAEYIFNTFKGDEDDEEEDPQDPIGDGNGDNIEGAFIADAESKELYEAQCASCHGDNGEGPFPPVGKELAQCRTCGTLQELADKTALNMPTADNPCTGECAEKVSAYIWAGFEVTDEQFDAN